MGKFDPRPGPEMIYGTEIEFHRLQIAAQMNLTEYGILSAVNVEQHIDHMYRGLIIRLRTEMLAHKALDTEVTVPFSGKTKRTRPGHHTKGVYVLPLLVAVSGVGSIISTSIVLEVVMFLMAVFALYFVAVNPDIPEHEEELPVHGEVKVPATYWRAFPQAEFQYPKDLGPIVYKQQLGIARYYET